MLAGMDFGDIAAPVNVGQVHEAVVTGSIADGKRVGEGALVEIFGSGVKVGGSSIGDGCEGEVVTSLRGAAASEKVAAVGDAGIVDLEPGCAAIEALPDAMVGVVGVHVPGVHFAEVGLTCTVGNHRNLTAIDRTGTRQNG